jgi:chromosome segregation ATPase
MSQKSSLPQPAESVPRVLTADTHRLSLQLRAAEDRIAELQAELERTQSRAVRAEQWLEAIKGEIEDKLIAPIEANRREPPVDH